MRYVKLAKPINTLIKSFQKNADGTVAKDEKGKDVVASERTLAIPGVEVRQYDSVAEMVQDAGSDKQFLDWANGHVRNDCVAPVRVVGGRFETSDKDEDIIAKGLELAKNRNPFVDLRGTSANAQNKQLADQMRQAQELAAKVKSGELSQDQLVQFILAGQL